MSHRTLVALSLFVSVAAIAWSEDRVFQPTTSDTPSVAPVTRLVVDPPSMSLEVGDEAPEFSYLGADGMWHEAAAIFGRGAVLLVFGARPEELRALEHERPRLGSLGVTLAFVLDARSSVSASMAKRLQLKEPIISDPRRAIAGLYNSLDRNTVGHSPSFFLVDESRRIRAIGHGTLPPPGELVTQSAQSLGREDALTTTGDPESPISHE